MDIFISIFLMSTTFNGHTHLSFALGFFYFAYDQISSISWLSIMDQTDWWPDHIDRLPPPLSVFFLFMHLHHPQAALLRPHL